MPAFRNHQSQAPQARKLRHAKVENYFAHSRNSSTMQTKPSQPLSIRYLSVCQVIHNFKGEEALRYDYIAVDSR
jgi:hypothetical protein